MSGTRYLVMLFVCLLIVGCAQEEEPTPEPVVRPAKLITVTQDSEVRAIRLPAIVGAADDAILTFQVNGLLEEIVLAEGEAVERGQVLARLDQRDFRNSVASAQATFDNAQIEFERAERLVAENAISRSIFDERRSARDVARASLDSARKGLDDTIIRAPFSGLVADIHVETFENVAAQQPVLTLQSAGDAEAIVQVPASLVVNIERLQPIDIGLELDAAPDLRMPASFVESASTADATTQTFEARFAFTPPTDLLILPGMTGILSGRFETAVTPGEVDTGSMAIPLTAVLAEAGTTYTWLVEDEGDGLHVTRRDITVGTGVGESVRIVDGLSEGDIIVAAGGSYLFEGAEIREYEN